MKKSTQQEYRKRILSVLVIKMTRKFAGQQDYVVSKLEAQWWLDGESCDLANTPEKLKTILRLPVWKRGT
jgi:hypothetical protein